VITGLAAALFFAWLAIEVASGNAVGFDLAVRGAIHRHASPWLTYAMRSVTQMGEPWFLITLGLLVAVILIRRGRGRAAMALAISTLGAELLDAILKLAFQRLRPAPFFGLPQPETYSFPSGHAMVSTCFFGGLAALLASGRARKAIYWAAAGAIAAVIGFSRIYLGVHYPTDVLGGYAAAIILLVLVYGGRRGRNYGNIATAPVPRL
jgi:undecaprenyl-diphosphatase